MFNSKALAVSMIGLLAPVFALATPSMSIWGEAAALVRSCASQTICVRKDGSRLASVLTSHCQDLTLNGSKARFILHGKVYEATISESEDSDGGDLNDLELADDMGTLIERHHNVLGFDDVLLTLLGGNSNSVRTAYKRCPASQ